MLAQINMTHTPTMNWFKW